MFATMNLIDFVELLNTSHAAVTILYM